LFTTPGDNKIKRIYPNFSVKTASSIIKEFAKQYNVSCWDYYTVMGGFGSIDYWRYENLAYKDYLHYTRKGYEYQAQLFFNAFLKSYDNFTKKEFVPEQYYFPEKH
jgi:lysophospholipase L1-like esterase